MIIKLLKKGWLIGNDGRKTFIFKGTMDWTRGDFEFTTNICVNSAVCGASSIKYSHFIVAKSFIFELESALGQIKSAGILIAVVCLAYISIEIVGLGSLIISVAVANAALFSLVISIGSSSRSSSGSVFLGC